ncbi:helix-turn-helix transcriptional regulator [Nocardioides solisilvae]|uniref:helix-turn-helix transcriptional regulator n=1 Tax=Nocardioides solisilvae TaxID=1542435 RepID=UPI000D7442FD|nr:WYL domain-containing protein [Nocardioides solisilvae]
MSSAGTGAREQVARLLTLVPLLHARGSVRLEDAAEALGTTTQQVVRDLKVLLMCGLPGGYPDDLIDVDLDALEGEDADGVIRVSNADYLSRPLRLTPTEATALIVALRAVRDSSPGATREVVDRTLAKLEQAAADGSAHRQVELDGTDPEAAEVRTTLERAVAEGRQVRLTYWVPTRDEAGERVVDPVRLWTQGGFDYLEAWCRSAEGRRVFRLDRIHALEVLEEPADAHDEAPTDLSEALFAHAREGRLATLRLRPGAHWVPEYYPVEEVRHVGEGLLEVDLRVGDPRWLVRLALRLAPHADVLGPPDLVWTCRQAAGDALALYDAPSSSMARSHPHPRGMT